MDYLNYEEIMSGLDELRRKTLGATRSLLDKIWVLLTNQQIENDHLKDLLEDIKRENDIHTEALKLMRGYEQKTIENTSEIIRTMLKERLDENYNPFEDNYIFEISYLDCCETIDEVCDEVRGELKNA